MKSANDHDGAILAMARYGGGFASALANAWMHADATNDARLCAAFPELLAQYGDIARVAQRQAGERAAAQRDDPA